MTRLRRVLVLLLAFLISFLLQLIVLPRVLILYAVPNFFLCLTVSSGLIFGSPIGLCIGFFSGLFLDLLGNGTPGYYLLIYCWIGYLDGLLSAKVEAEMVPMLFLFFIANEIVFHLYCFVFSFVPGKSYAFFDYLTSVFLPETILTVVVFLIVHGILVFVSKRFDLKIRKGEVKVV